ncbi:hypothetical protein EX895_006111 [Sporisorium graminicola]|uniref:Zn(2)-C6 fungal-type domain-containing protein n=1 Tax=Sporisorium graminicola TaxID=280036 RepID=A0A4U7KLE3_9BASI|nr:hypothetical protein EX895_006111 [Sporisorium graminicola]TKY85031.1 hypothetical protein EX895_006111 [Sporisorium graminicola]
MISPYDSTYSSRPALARKRTSDKVQTEQPDMDPASPSGSQDGKGKTRARINMACIHCRHRKIKCDGTQPACATCVRLRRECEYEPVTEYENLVSRERKRRNKEKKAARMASLGIFAGQSPLSMLHPATTLGLPSTPLAHYGDLSQQNMTPGFVSVSDPRSETASVESQFGPRRRRGISDTQAATMQHRLGPFTSPLPDAAYQHASVSQPPTPAQAYRYYQSLAVSPAQDQLHADFFSLSTPFVPPTSSGPFFSSVQSSPAIAHAQQMMASPQIVDLIGLSSSTSVPEVPSGCASATEADFNLGMVDMSGVPMVVPTSAHVRPVDLPAPHGHFDFASIPFPTQDTFSLELPLASLRRRSSIHLPVGTADAFRRPSVAEVATAALMQRVAVKRAEKIDTDIKQLADNLLTPDASGIVAWNVHVQSQLPASMASWSGFQTTGKIAPSQPASNSEYVPVTMPTSRSNSDGLLSLDALSPPAPLITGLVKAEPGTEEISAASSCSVSSSTADTASLTAEVPMLDPSYFPNNDLSREMSPFALSPSSGNSSSGMQSSLLSQGAWSTSLPLLSPVSELNNTFHSFNVFSTNAAAAATTNPTQQFKTEDDLTSMPGFAFNSTF